MLQLFCLDLELKVVPVPKGGEKREEGSLHLQLGQPLPAWWMEREKGGCLEGPGCAGPRHPACSAATLRGRLHRATEVAELSRPASWSCAASSSCFTCPTPAQIKSKNTLKLELKVL